MRLRSLALASVTTLVLAATSGCSDGADDTRGDRDSVRDALRSSFGPMSKDELPPCTDEPATTADGLTEPGQVLCFGTAAVLPVEAPFDGGTGTASITMTGFVRGDDSLIDAQITDGFPEWTSANRELWYATATIETVGESEPGALDGTEPIGFESSIRDADGDAADSGLLLDRLDDCEATDLGDDDGAPVDTCTWGLLEPGTEPWSVRWFDTGDYFTDQVVWAAE